MGQRKDARRRRHSENCRCFTCFRDEATEATNINSLEIKDLKKRVKELERQVEGNYGT